MSIGVSKVGSVKRVWRGVAALCTLAVTLLATACGTSDTRTQLTVWSWEPSMSTLIANFEHDNPDIHVTLNTNTDYDKLNSAIQDGYGMPDIAQLEYYVLPQYAVSGQLHDITDYAHGYDSFYTPGSWASVQLADRTYALPMDSGPMAFFYNNDVFEEAGVDASKITTWQEYYEAAKKLQKIGIYITADSGDASFYNAMIWLAGGHPYTTSSDGRDVTINLTSDAGTSEFTKYWQKMLDEGLIKTNETAWSDEWKTDVANGNIASLFAGAWLPSLLLSNIPAGAGLWRVTQMPTPHGEVANSENGGSALAILQSSRKPQAAWRFINYVCHSSEGISTRVDGGAFPADNATLQSKEFLAKTTIRNDEGTEIPYFGGEKFNEILATAASRVTTGYSYLPFEVYARSDFNSTVKPAYQWITDVMAYRKAIYKLDQGLISSSAVPVYPGEQITLEDGLKNWQADLIEYGRNQGFTVNGKTMAQ